MNETLMLMSSGTQGTAERSRPFARFVGDCLGRFHVGDWGAVDAHDQAANDAAMVNGSRILASYSIPEDLAADIDEITVWLILEADRSALTVLFPSEY